MDIILVYGFTPAEQSKFEVQVGACPPYAELRFANTMSVAMQHLDQEPYPVVVILGGKVSNETAGRLEDIDKQIESFIATIKERVKDDKHYQCGFVIASNNDRRSSQLMQLLHEIDPKLRDQTKRANAVIRAKDVLERIIYMRERSL